MLSALIRLSILLLFAGLLSCAHNNVRTSWIKEYQDVDQKNKKRDLELCAPWIDLSLKKVGPIAKLAEIRAIENCPSEYWAERKFKIDDFPTWLQERFIDSYLQYIPSLNREDERALLLVEKSKLVNRQDFKVKFLQEALVLSKKNKLPDGPASETETLVQTELYGAAPRLNPAPELQDLLSVAEDQRSNRNYDGAIATYKKILSNAPVTIDVEIRARDGILKTHKLAEAKLNYLEEYQAFVTFLDQAIAAYPRDRRTQDLFWKNQISYARALWTQNRVVDADSHLQKLITRFKIVPAEIYWLAGRIKEERSDFGGAVQDFTLALALKTSNETRSRLLWQRAWNNRKLAAYPEAIADLDELRLMPDNDLDRPRYSYWRARVIMAMGDSEKAQDAFRDTLELDPIGFYGFLSARELKVPIELQTTETDTELGTFPAPGDAQLFSDLMTLGEVQVSKRYLDSISQNSYKDPNWFSLMKAYARVGHFTGLFRQVAMLEPHDRIDFVKSHPKLVFPRNFIKPATQASKRFQVPLPLIFAIIRQESAFDPEARSVADALGLMQLLPRVGAEIGKQYKIPFKGPQDLLIPEKNIQIGAAYLKNLFQQNQGQFIASVAQYNANREAFESWVKTRFRNDSTEFIEDIPYEETRNYVKLVMRNYILYGRLLGEPPGLFPEDCLRVGQFTKN